MYQQRFAALQGERDDLYTKFESSIYEVQQKNGLKSMLLERKLEAMAEVLEKKEAQLGEVLSAANLDPATLQQLSTKLDEMLDGKNALIRALQFEKAKAQSQHESLIQRRAAGEGSLNAIPSALSLA